MEQPFELEFNAKVLKVSEHKLADGGLYDR